jgi:hypothetical protein
MIRSQLGRKFQFQKKINRTRNLILAARAIIITKLIAIAAVVTNNGRLGNGLNQRVGQDCMRRTLQIVFVIASAGAQFTLR